MIRILLHSLHRLFIAGTHRAPDLSKKWNNISVTNSFLGCHQGKSNAPEQSTFSLMIDLFS